MKLPNSHHTNSRDGSERTSRRENNHLESEILNELSATEFTKNDSEIPTSVVTDNENETTMVDDLPEETVGLSLEDKLDLMSEKMRNLESENAKLKKEMQSLVGKTALERSSLYEEIKQLKTKFKDTDNKISSVLSRIFTPGQIKVLLNPKNASVGLTRTLLAQSV